MSVTRRKRDTYNILLFGLEAALHKLDFFLVVDEGADASDDHNGHEDSSSLNPR